MELNSQPYTVFTASQLNLSTAYQIKIACTIAQQSSDIFEFLLFCYSYAFLLLLLEKWVWESIFCGLFPSYDEKYLEPLQVLSRVATCASLVNIYILLLKSKIFIRLSVEGKS